MKCCKQLLKDSDYCILEEIEIYNHTDAKKIACLQQNWLQVLQAVSHKLLELLDWKFELKKYNN